MYKTNLENILQKYFKCKKPFLKHPYYDYEEYPVTLTRHGGKAYGDLIGLLYDVGDVCGIDVNDIVDKLDSIVSEIE